MCAQIRQTCLSVTPVRLACLLALLFAAPLASSAEEFPSRAIKLVVPFPAGGPADTFARVLADKMSALLGKSVVIENRAGAGGLTGTASVAKADPDGHTIGIAASSALAINVNLRDNMPFRPLTDLRLLTQVASVPEILVVGEGVPARTLAEFIALAKAQPGRLVFASTGLGGMPHLATELLKISAGIELVHVPYTGAAPAVNDLLGGHVQMMFADIPVLLGAVQSGKLRALAIGAKARSPSLPDVATTAELGMPQVEADNWYGLVVAAATPAPIAEKLRAAAVEALHAAEVKDKFLSQGALAVGNSSEEFTPLREGRDRALGSGDRHRGHQAQVADPPTSSRRRHAWGAADGHPPHISCQAAPSPPAQRTSARPVHLLKRSAHAGWLGMALEGKTFPGPCRATLNGQAPQHQTANAGASAAVLTGSHLTHRRAYPWPSSTLAWASRVCRLGPSAGTRRCCSGPRTSCS